MRAASPLTHEPLTHERVALMATTPRHPVASSPRHGRFVGRVGALAVALGIGAALANSPAIAGADDDGTSASKSSAGSADDGAAGAASDSAASSQPDSDSAPKTTTTDDESDESPTESGEDRDTSPAPKTRGPGKRATVDVDSPIAEDDRESDNAGEPATRTTNLRPGVRGGAGP